MGVRTEQRTYLTGSRNVRPVAGTELYTVDEQRALYQALNTSTKQFISKMRGYVRTGGRWDRFRDYEQFREWFLEELYGVVNHPETVLRLWDGVDVEALTHFVWACELT